MYQPAGEPAHVDDVELAVALVDRVDADLGAVAVPAGMEIAADLAGDRGRREEAAHVHAPVPGQVVEDQRAAGPAPGIGVGEQPAAVGRVAAVAVLGQQALAEHLHLVVDAVPEDQVAVADAPVGAPGQDVVRVAPVEVGHRAVGGDDGQLAAVGPRRHHAVMAGRVGAGLPAMEEDEPLVVGRELEVVEAVHGAVEAGGPLDAGHLRQGEDQAVLAGLDIEPPDPVVLRLRHLPPGVGHPWVAVPGPLMLQAGEARGHRLPAVAAQGVDRARQGAHHRPARRLPHDGDETVAAIRNILPAALAGPLRLLARLQPVVVDDPGCLRPGVAGGRVSGGVRHRQPVEHRALLPAPGAGAAEGPERPVALQVDDAHGGAVPGGGRPPEKVRLQAEQVAPAAVPAALVVVPEEVMPGSARHRADGEVRLPARCRGWVAHRPDLPTPDQLAPGVSLSRCFTSRVLR